VTTNIAVRCTDTLLESHPISSHPILPVVTATPDRSTLTSGHQDGSLRFWDYLRSSQCTHTVTKLHTAHITNVQYSPRNSHDVLTLSKDNTLCILDTRNYTAVKVREVSYFSTLSDRPDLIILHALCFSSLPVVCTARTA
jgi:WD40 repeat protein